MKLISDAVYGHQRAYVTATAVVWIEGWKAPHAAICAYIQDGEPMWHPFDCGSFALTFQPDPSKLQPGEWCWPVTEMPVTYAQVVAVRDREQCSMSAARLALKQTHGDVEKACEWVRKEGYARGKPAMPDAIGPAHDALRRVMASAGVSESAARMALEHTNGDVDAAVAGLAHYK